MKYIKPVVVQNTILDNVLNTAPSQNAVFKALTTKVDLVTFNNKSIDWTAAFNWGDHSTVGYATQSWVTGKNYLTSQSLTGYATESWVNTRGFLTSYIDTNTTYTPGVGLSLVGTEFRNTAPNIDHPLVQTAVPLNAKFTDTVYTHPSTHPASMITEDTTHRFATDSEKSTWNAKANTSVVTTTANGLMSSTDKSKLDGIATNANNYVHPTSGVAAGTYRSVTVNTSGHITTGTNPTTVSGYGLTDVYTKTENNTSLALKVNNSEKGVANGIATLDTNGKVVLTQIPDSLLGQLEYIGTWNFATLPTATEKGQYWIASVAGNGYEVGDWAVWNGAAFDKVDNTDAVSTVAGRTGNVVLTKSDVGLGLVDNTADASKNVLSATKLATARTITMSGDVTGSTSFDGSGNVTLVTQVADDSHTHSFANLTSTPATATRWPTWSEVSSKPTTFAPSSHTHTVSQVTDLGTAATTAATDYAKSQGRVVNDGNLFLDSGMYGINGAPTNTVSGYGAMIVARNIDTGLQISGGHNTDHLYFRGWSGSGSTFTPWRMLYHSGNLPATPPTNLGITAGTTAGPTVTSSTGTNATLPTASATASGVLTTGAQTIAGVKTFSSTITGNISGNAGTATKLSTIATTFSGTYPVTVNDNGTIYSHTGVTINGSTSTATADNWILTSDVRYKTNIKPLEIEPLNIDYVEFEMKKNLGERRFGVIAQDLQKNHPELVKEDTDGYLAVSYTELLLREVAFLKEKINILEAENKKKEDRLLRIEKLLDL